MSETMIADSAERLFSKNVDKNLREAFDKGIFPGALWKLVEEAGFTNALASEESGGIGISWLDAYPVLRGLGYWQAPIPLASHMIASFVLAASGQTIPEGPLTIAEADLADALKVSQVGTGASLSGKLTGVEWASGCKSVLISIAASQSAEAGRLMLVDLDQPAVRIEPYQSHAGEPQDTLHFAGATIRAILPNPYPSIGRPLQMLGALSYSAMICGALESALEQSVAYAKDRVQFGRPIAGYQAIQQQLAQVAGELASVRTAVLTALEGAGPAGSLKAETLEFDVAVAKVRAGEAATLAAAVCHQVHGAIGFTHEHPLHFATRRLLAWRTRHGSDAEWATQLGRLAIAGGGDDFWMNLTARFAARQSAA